MAKCHLKRVTGYESIDQAWWKKKELKWPQPVTLNALEIVWNGRQRLREWYSIEYWDGKRWQLLTEEEDNRFMRSPHQFQPVSTDHLRLTVWGDMRGWRVDPMIKEVKVYNRTGDIWPRKTKRRDQT